jgi:hypothetical protein
VTIILTIVSKILHSRNYLVKKGILPQTYGPATLLVAFITIILLISSHFDPLILVWTCVYCVFLLLTMASLAWTLEFFNLGRRQFTTIDYKKYLFFSLLIGILTAVLFCVGVYFIYLTIRTGVFESLLAIVFVIVLMAALHYYYHQAKKKLKVDVDDVSLSRPSFVKAFVLVNKFNQPSIRAISYAKALYEDVQILSFTENSGEKIVKQWKKIGINVPLRLQKAQSSDMPKSIASFVTNLKRKNSRELVVIYIPNFVTNKIWENFLHNHISRRITLELEKIPGTVVCLVPFQG